MDRSKAAAILTAAIQRITGAEHVKFDEDGEHVYIGPVDGYAIRYRLGPDTQRFLHGEFSVDDKLPIVTLEIPTDDEADPDSD